jgi:hypothetical protein
MMSDAFSCGCKGTVHDPACWTQRQAAQRMHAPATFVADAEDKVLRRLDRIIVLLEEIAGRRR